jgi:predicted dehydrogenase
MSAPLKLAVIGTNWITNSFVQSAHESSKFQLVAVYSRSLETARKFIAETPSITDTSSVRSYDDLDALLSDNSAGVDVVYIASPNSLHYAQGLQVLNAGKHAIIEKPIASNAKEMAALYSRADSKGLFLLEAFRHIQEPNFLKLRELLDNESTKVGKFGPIYGASLSMAVYSSRYAKVLQGEEPNVLSPKFSGGALWDMGCYPVMFAVALFGKPTAETYHPVIIRTGTDGGGHIILQYSAESSRHKAKFTVHAHTSKIYTSTAPTEIYCEKGTIRINGATGVTDINTIEFVPRGSKEGEQLADTKPEYQGLLNLTWEAKELARIIQENDKKAEGALRELTTHVLTAMESMRKQNNIVFDAEK